MNIDSNVNMLSQLKKNYEQLCQISTSVTDEEEALYEFLEESDIFATLLLVYDSFYHNYILFPYKNWRFFSPKSSVDFGCVREKIVV